MSFWQPLLPPVALRQVYVSANVYGWNAYYVEFYVCCEAYEAASTSLVQIEPYC